MPAELTALYEIVTPVAATNLGDNPSVETDLNRWTAVGTAATVARDNTEARFGRYSVKVVSGTDVLSGGFYYTAAAGISVSSSTAMAVSFYVKNTARSMRISVRDQAGVELAVKTVTASAKWKLVTLAFTTGGSSTTVHFRFTNDNDATTHDFFVDAVLPELGAATTYVDGDQPDCFWDGVEHASTSQREAFGQGGLPTTLDSLGITVEGTTGLGMPALVLNRQDLGQLPGSVLEDVKVRERVATLVLNASGSTLTNLHKLRADLIDAIKPDRTAAPVQFRITYKGTDEEVHAHFAYEDGLGGGRREGFFETFGMRLLATNPFWFEDLQEISKPGFTQDLTKDRVLRRRRGEWGFPTTGANGNVLAIAEAPDGTVYFGGVFTDFAGVANTTRLAQLKGGVITALDGGVDNGEVRALAVAPDGTLYIGGTSTAVNSGTTVNRFWKYDPATDTFSALGGTPGVDGAVNGISIGLDGSVYPVGEFADEGTRITKWDGSVFSDPFGAGANATLRAVVTDAIGNLFIGGDQTSLAGVTSNRIHKWDVAAAVATAVGGNGQLNALCRALAIAKDGLLFAGGDFTTASGNTVNRIAQFGGADWLAMESGVDNLVYSLAMIDDFLWLGGTFLNTAATPALSMPRLGFWNGTTFVRSDVDLPGSPIVHAIAGAKKDVHIGHTTTGTIKVGKLTAVSNTGTASAYPIAVFTGPGTLKWLENFSTGDRLYFDLQAQAGEEITIDFRTGVKKITSNWRPAPLLPLRASDFGSWRLLPGSNDVVAYITGSTGATEIHFRWQLVHWSRDGGSP